METRFLPYLEKTCIHRPRVVLTIKRQDLLLSKISKISTYKFEKHLNYLIEMVSDDAELMSVNFR